MTAKARPCKRCHGEIPAERVEAVRGTEVCAKCSQEIGGEFQLSFTEENIAKEGSMKKNYSGVKIKKTRRKIRFPDKE